MEVKYLGTAVSLSSNLVQLFAEGIMSNDDAARLVWLAAYDRLLYSSSSDVVGEQEGREQ